MSLLEDNQVTLVIFAFIGLKFTLFFLVKLAIKFYPLLFCSRRRFEWTTASGYQWAVVTGATDGTGYEFARQLAQKGYNLLLISRSEERLLQVRQRILNTLTVHWPPAAEAEAEADRASDGSMVDIDIAPAYQSPIQIRTLAVEFSHLYVYKKIEQFLKPVQNEIAILVNNVGHSLEIPDRFIAEEPVNHQEMINVNVNAGTRMLELVLPAMVKQQRGLVITVSSLSGKHLTPLNSVYSATKAYISHLADSLAEEHRDDGITFCTLHPYRLYTKMTLYSEVGAMTPTPENYVSSALSVIKYADSISITGYWSHSLLDALLNLITSMSSRAASGQFMKSLMEQYRSRLLRTHKPDEAEDGASPSGVATSNNNWGLSH